MGRWACIDVPALPLQLLLRREPTWAGEPAAVVERDSPQGRLLWVNEAARRGGVLPGMRYAAALALQRGLRAGVVDADEVAAGVAGLVAALRELTPDVEPCDGQPGVFWLRGDGLERLFASASAWGRALHEAIAAAGFVGTAVVGFTRYGTYAVALGTPPDAPGGPLRVFREPEQEQRVARAVPLARLGLDPALRDDLGRLGVETLGAFLELPAAELQVRFGDAAARLHALGAGRAWAPLQPSRAAERHCAHVELGFADDDRTRLLFVLKEQLDPLLARLAVRGLAVRELRIALRLETRALCEELLRPAEPTRDAVQLVDLLRLRLEALVLPAKVEEVELELVPAAVGAQQGELFAATPRRDPAAANRALARLRAELGPAAVVRARLVDAWRPETTFLWEPLERLAAVHASAARADTPGVTPAEASVLVRRLRAQPLALPPRRHFLRDDGWLIHGPGPGAVRRLVGPFVQSGGWWEDGTDGDGQREYHFAETARGDLLWVFYEPGRRRWFLHGAVE